MGVLVAAMFMSRSSTISAGQKTEGIAVGELFVKFPSAKGFFSREVYTPSKKADSIITLIQDNIPAREFPRELPDFSKIDTAEIVRIAYPGNRNEYTGVIDARLKSGRCRILHYGDSQIEGDRISGYLRNRLQGIYGGSGPGFLPIKQVYEQNAAEISVSDNWIRLAAFDPNSEPLPDKNYGMFASVSRFTPVAINTSDTLSPSDAQPVKASIRIRPSQKSYPRLRNYTHVGIHYGNARYATHCRVYSDGNLVGENQLINDGRYHCFEIENNAGTNEILVEFESVESPDFYGITLDGSSGICLDNIAMRGASGTIFRSMSQQAFVSMAARLNPEILIFQYGGNTIPYVKDSAAVASYAGYLLQQITWIRRQIPGVVVIFIGPGDMSTSVDGQMITYPLLPYLDERLQASCLKNGVAYWSMYKAMGGENSMPLWVEQGLAGSDYTHFSPKGTRIIAELFFTSLYLDLR